MLGSYKRNPKLHSSVYAEAPKDATHYNKFKPCKFLRKFGPGNAYFSASRRSWVEYYNISQGKLDLAAAEPLYPLTFRVNPYDVAIVDGATTAAPVYQTQQELIDENKSLAKQIVKLEARLEKKRCYRTANAKKISAWNIIMDT
jgi:hypothetical protein